MRYVFLSCLLVAASACRSRSGRATLQQTPQASQGIEAFDGYGFSFTAAPAKGVIVSQVQPGSAAEKEGFQAGDSVVSTRFFTIEGPKRDEIDPPLSAVEVTVHSPADLDAHYLAARASLKRVGDFIEIKIRSKNVMKVAKIPIL